MSKLYVKGVKRTPNDTLYSFLLRNLTKFKHWTTIGKFNSTYFDPEFKQIQCDSRHRSFEDIVLISKTYFKVSDKQVAKAIIRVLNEQPKFSLLLCDSINKWVIQHGFTKIENSNYCAKYNNAHLKLNNKYGKYSYNDIMVLAGLPKEK